MDAIPSSVPLGAPPAGVTSDFSHPVDDQRYAELVAIIVVFTFVSTACVLARVWTRVFVVRLFGWDDGLAVFTMLLNFGLTVCWGQQISTGVADYDWNVRENDWFANDVNRYGLYNALATLFLFIAFGTVKLSILMLYLRLLGPAHRTLRIYVYVAVFCVASANFAFVVALLKYCTPTAKLFDFSVSGTCVSHSELFFVQGIAQCLTDVLILVPPIPVVWRLKTTVARKVGFVIIFCTGFVVTAIGVVRTVYMAPGIDDQIYILYGQYTGTLWCILEINLSLTVVCLPALNQLLREVTGGHRRPSQALINGAANGNSPDAATPPAEKLSDRKKRSSVSRIINGLYSDMANEPDSDKRTLTATGTQSADEKQHADSASSDRSLSAV